MTPVPASFMPSAMPISSASEARSDGVGSPFTVRWLSVREVEKPSAPARIASAVSARICAISSGVASSSLARALAHHVDAQRAVRQLRAEIDVARPRFERVEVLAERFPRPVQALVERRAGNVLDAFHQLDQALAVLGLHRREADAAIAHHHRGDAVPARGLQTRVPGRLAVVVGVDVDEARRDQQALGVDLLGARAATPCRPRRSCRPSTATSASRSAGARAVDHRAAADDQIEFRPMFASPGLPGVYLIVSGGRTPATARRRSGIRRWRATAAARAWPKAPGRRGRRRARRRCRTSPRTASPSRP